jgi:hypothetical protein
MSIACIPKSGYDYGMDDNTYECPNCGGVIYPEMTRCPQCGQNMYPEDNTITLTEGESTTTNWGTILGAVLIGWLVASGVATVIHFLVAEFVTLAQLADIGKLPLFLAGPVGSLVGGYVCAGLNRQYPKLLGGLVGILTLPISVLLATHWVHVTLTLLFSPWFLISGVLIVLAGVCGGWLYQIFTQESEWQEKLKVRGWEDLLYQDLLRKVRFNGSAADRLIEYERRLEPQASRLKLIQNAIERWEKDNR